MSSPVFTPSMNPSKVRSPPRSGHGRHPSNSILGGIGFAGSPFASSSTSSPAPMAMSSQFSGQGFTPSATAIGMVRSPSNLGGGLRSGTGGMGGSNAGSPLANANLINGIIGAGSNTGLMNNSAGVPSPSVFANMAASVGAHDPLDENNATINDGSLQIAHTPNALGGSTNSSNSVTNPKPSDIAVAAMHTMDPFSALMYNVEQFTNTQLNQLETLSDRFFDLYENVLLENNQIQMKDVIEAHTNLVSFIDQLLSTSVQAGFSGLNCPTEESSKRTKSQSSLKSDEVTMTNVEDDEQLTIKPQPSDSNDLIAQLTAQSKDSFERRERLRESASMITNILAHTS